MAPRNTARTDAVKVLRAIAGRYGVERVSDNASKAKVTTMSQAILAAGDLTSEDRQAAKDAWGSYESTWSEDQSQGLAQGGIADGGASKATREWFFHAAQLTYSCTEGEWASKDKEVLKALFDRFVLYMQTMLTELQPKGISATMEESTKTGEHVHMHAYIHFEKAFHRQGADVLACFAFEGIQPHVRPNTARGKAYDGAMRMGHYYVVVDKIGSIFEWTNFPPFQAYGVEPWWLDNWLKSGKFTRKTYLAVAARIGIGFQRRLADIRAAERYEREQAVEEYVATESAAAAEALLQPKNFPEVEEFISLFAAQQTKMRRPMLAIVGGTNLGKSLLAASVLRRLAVMLGVAGFLEVTVEGSPHLDMGGFDHRVHAGVLLDGVGDTKFLKAHREVLQGRPKVCKGGQSATNVYAFSYCLARRGVVATFDLSAKNLHAFSADHWLSERRNVIVLRLTEKAYIEPNASTLPPIGTAASSRVVPSSPVLQPPAKRRPVGSPTTLPALPTMPGAGR